MQRLHPDHVIAFLFHVMAYSSAIGGMLGSISLFNEYHPLSHANLIAHMALTLRHILWLPSIYVPLFLIPLYFPTGKLLSSRWPWPLYGISDTRTPNGIPGTELFFDTQETMLQSRIQALILVSDN